MGWSIRSRASSIWPHVQANTITKWTTIRHSPNAKQTTACRAIEMVQQPAGQSVSLRKSSGRTLHLWPDSRSWFVDMLHLQFPLCVDLMQIGLRFALIAHANFRFFYSTQFSGWTCARCSKRQRCIYSNRPMWYLHLFMFRDERNIYWIFIRKWNA